MIKQMVFSLSDMQCRRQNCVPNWKHSMYKLCTHLEAQSSFDNTEEMNMGANDRIGIEEMLLSMFGGLTEESDNDHPSHRLLKQRIEQVLKDNQVSDQLSKTITHSDLFSTKSAEAMFARNALADADSAKDLAVMVLETNIEAEQQRYNSMLERLVHSHMLVKSLAADLRTANESNESLEQANQELTQKHDGLETKVENLQGRVDNLNQYTNQQESRINKLKDQQRAAMLLVSSYLNLGRKDRTKQRAEVMAKGLQKIFEPAETATT